MRQIITVDPGKGTTSIAIIEQETQASGLTIRALHTFKEKDAHELKQNVFKWLYEHGVAIDTVVQIEWPDKSAGRQYTQDLLNVALIAAELGAYLSGYVNVEFIPASRLNGILPNRVRKLYFERLFGPVRSNEHQRDAALTAAMILGFLPEGKVKVRKKRRKKKKAKKTTDLPSV